MELERGVMGAFAFYTENEMLAKHQLDLGAWHVFNEVVRRAPCCSPSGFSFDFHLQDGALIALLFHRTPDGASAGVRLSANATASPNAPAHRPRRRVPRARRPGA